MSSWAKSEENPAEVAKRVAFRHETMLKQAAQEATHIFSDPVEVKEEERLHGLRGILEKKLSEASVIDASTSALKKNYILGFLEDELKALDSETLKHMGFENGTVSLLRPGAILDLSIIDKEGWVRAVR